MTPEIHVSGRGARTPFGPGRAELLDAVFAGHTALTCVRRLAERGASTRVAAEMPESFVREAGSENQLARAMALCAAEEALDEAGAPERASLGLVLSTTKADLSGVWGAGHGLGNGARLADELAAALGIGGERRAVSCACASGLAAIAVAARALARGAAERVLVIGTDGLTPFVLRGFESLLALDPDACRPFDVDRRGLSLGEAAGALVLSVHASESIGVRVAGWGEGNDANHVTGPSRDGEGLRLAAQRALDRAGVGTAGVGYVHLHGTGTRYNDAMEGEALARLFEGATPPASGTKAQTGHTLGAAGLIESLVAIEALRRGRAPANVGLERSDVRSELELVREPTAIDPDAVALKLAAGFGGIDAALAFQTGTAFRR